MYPLNRQRVGPGLLVIDYELAHNRSRLYRSMDYYKADKMSKSLSHRKKGTIRIGWERDDGKKIIIHHKPVLRKKRESAFNWFEEFAMEWSETFISKK